MSESETLAGVRDRSAPLLEAGPAGDEPRPGRTLIFAIVSIGLFMASVDQTIVATALPAIQHELHTQINWSGWTITIYALGQVVAMPLAGSTCSALSCWPGRSWPGCSASRTWAPVTCPGTGDVPWHR